MEVRNFAILQGLSAKIKDGQIIYNKVGKSPSDGKTSPSSKNDTDYDVVTLRSDIHFSSGTLEFTVKPKSYDTGVLLILTSSDGKQIKCGYSGVVKKFAIAVEQDNLMWKALSEAGKLSDYPLNQEIKFKVTISGSLISLFINNILMVSANISIKDGPIQFEVWSVSEFELSKIVKHSTRPKAFVVMQFSTEYNELYEEVIRPVTEKFGYECVRADEYYTGTPILNDIVKSIQESTVVIAEITPDNPNVFYEIGYSHAIAKPTILLCDKKREKLPFDISGFRTLFYENTIAGKKKVENNLTKYLELI